MTFLMYQVLHNNNTNDDDNNNSNNNNNNNNNNNDDDDRYSSQLTKIAKQSIKNMKITL